MNEYAVNFGKMDFVVYVRARSAASAVRVAKAIEPNAAALCKSRRQSVSAFKVS